MTSERAFVQFSPSMEYQRKQSESGMSGQFVVQYDVERQDGAGEILVTGNIVTICHCNVVQMLCL